MPTVRSDGSLLHCADGFIAPCGSNASVDASMPTSWMPELVKTDDLIEVVANDVDVHHLRELVDIDVALIEQVRGGGVAGTGRRQLAVDLRDPLHRIVRPRHRVGQPELGIAAQRLDVGGHAVELLRQHLRGIDDRAYAPMPFPGSSSAPGASS